MQTLTRDRAGAMACTAVMVAGLGFVLVRGLAWTAPPAAIEALKIFAVAPPPPPPPPARTEPKPIHSKRPEGAASPPNLRAKATELVVPPPIVPPIQPPPVIAALTPGIGAAANTGAAPVPGPGTGAGGAGNGTGSGASGDGDGDGGDETPPRLIRGRIKDSDYPRGAAEAGVRGTVSVRYTVETDGRVTGCAITRSSGNAELDETTCRLIEKRFRYSPWRDAAGRPVRSTVVSDHDWIIDRLPPDPS
jgi:protein TonB